LNFIHEKSAKSQNVSLILKKSVNFGFNNLTKAMLKALCTPTLFHKKEAEDGTASVREHGVGDKGTMSFDAVLEVFAGLRKV
jgi:hypothetical protein